MRPWLLEACLLGTAALFSAALAARQPPVEIESRLELFVDGLLVERMQDVRFELHHPIKTPRPQSPLPAHHMITVIKDGELYRAWYRSNDPAYKGPYHTGHAGETVSYAESRDGHEWQIPKLRLHEVGGTLDNNAILVRMPRMLHNLMPFIDPRPGVPKAERYKAVSGYPGVGNKWGLDKPGHGLFAWVSADGIHWTRKEEIIRYRPQWRHAFDSPNVAFWSAAEQQFVCYFRTWMEPGNLRSVSRSTSPDFVNWSDPVEMRPNLPGEHLYTTMTHPYVRAPHIYIALPTRYVPGRGTAPSYEQKDRNVTDILFMTSRAGTNKYDRTFTESFIRPGLNPARWANRENYAANNVILTAPDELSIYHKSGDRYVLRPDGFISIHAGAATGELLTKPLTFAGGELVLNFSTGAAGEVRVEIQDASNGEPIPGLALEDGEPLFGDSLEHVVRWPGGNLAAIAGRSVRLRFVLRECDLYSFRFR